ncbi:MAG: hypothetical protein KAJ19_24630, partial [Gammaproteobacteria bacterium]|nr:hypothetical protein [Gammaproteobacteria bacterium]
PQIADVWKAGKLSQAKAGLRGVTFAGKRVASPTAGYRFAERFPAWLAGGEAGLAAIGQKAGKAQSFIEANIPGLRKAGKEIGEKFTAGDTLFRGLREKVIGGRRLGQVTEARFGEQMLPLAKRWKGLIKGADEAAVRQTFLQTY